METTDTWPLDVDVVVVGGGIVGARCAEQVAARGARVALVDKEGDAGQEGSGRALGAIRIQGRHPAEIPLARAARDRWADEGERGDFELTWGGNIYLAREPAEVPALQRLVDEARSAGFDVELLPAAAAREVLPAATGAFSHAMYSAIDGHCQPVKATHHFAAAARRNGAVTRFGTLVRRVMTAGDRVTGVVTDHGAIRAGAVVIAGGVWTPHLASTAGVSVPIMPVSYPLAETDPVPPLFTAAVRSATFSGRQRPDGRVVVSAGLSSKVGHALSPYDLRHLRHWAPRLLRFRREVRLRVEADMLARQVRAASAISPRTVPVPSPEPPADRPQMDRALDAMREVFPAMRSAQLRTYWSGLVDMSPDGLPIVDGACGPTGLTIVTGLCGHGLALGPVLGEIAADLALGDEPAFDISAFRLARLHDGPVPMPDQIV